MCHVINFPSILYIYTQVKQPEAKKQRTGDDE